MTCRSRISPLPPIAARPPGPQAGATGVGRGDSNVASPADGFEVVQSCDATALANAVRGVCVLIYALHGVPLTADEAKLVARMKVRRHSNLGRALQPTQAVP